MTPLACYYTCLLFVTVGYSFSTSTLFSNNIRFFPHHKKATSSKYVLLNNSFLCELCAALCIYNMQHLQQKRSEYSNRLYIDIYDLIISPLLIKKKFQAKVYNRLIGLRLTNCYDQETDVTKSHYAYTHQSLIELQEEEI